MRTKGDALINKIEDSIMRVQNLISISHVEEEYSEIVKALGGEIEKFLKMDVLNLSNKNFQELIEELKNHGINQINVDYIHAFRLCYNGYKHSPTFSKTIFEVKLILQNLKCSMSQINTLNLGNVSLAYQNKSKRVVWFAGWDDYMGGMVECDIFIPNYNMDMPIGIDHFNIDWKAWDLIIDKFTKSTDLLMGKEHVSDKAYDFWKAQGDFIDAGAYVGDVSEFVRELSLHIAKNEKDLIPFLKRDHSSYSVYCSIVFSIYDTLRENKWLNIQDFKDELLLRMSYDYGIDLKSPLLEYLNYLDFDTINTNRDQLKNTNDILWIDAISYQNKKIGVISEKLHIGFDKYFNLVTKLN